MGTSPSLDQLCHLHLSLAQLILLLYLGVLSWGSGPDQLSERYKVRMGFMATIKGYRGVQNSDFSLAGIDFADHNHMYAVQEF